MTHIKQRSLLFCLTLSLLLTSPITQALNAITYGNGLFVGVGNKGLIQTSTGDPEMNWQRQELGIEPSFYAVTYGDGLWVVVGEQGVIFYSTDAKQWLPFSTSQTNNLRSIAYGDGKFIAVGDNNTVVSLRGRRHGLELIPNDTPLEGFLPTPSSTNGLSNIAYGLGKFLVFYDEYFLYVCRGGTSISKRKLKFHEGVFVLVSYYDRQCGNPSSENVRISTDGTHWQDTGHLARGRGGIQANGQIVVVGGDFVAGEIHVSKSADAPQFQTIPFALVLQDVAYGNGRWVAVGGNDHIILHSEDAKTWQPYVAQAEDGYHIPTRFSPIWLKAIIQTAERGPIPARWRHGGEGLMEPNYVTWGYFYADPTQVPWGSAENPEVFVKIWYDRGDHRIDVNFFHVSVPDVEVYSRYMVVDPVSDSPYNGKSLAVSGKTSLQTRYVRHYYRYFEGKSFSESTTEDGIAASGYVTNNNPPGYLINDQLHLGAVIRTNEAGPIDALLRFGNNPEGTLMTNSRGDRVLWGYFYADPNLVRWGHFNNPEVFLKVWYDVSGRLDVNYFHVSVPDIEVYSDYPDDGVYNQRGVAIMADRYIRHEFQQ